MVIKLTTTTTTTTTTITTTTTTTTTTNTTKTTTTTTTMMMMMMMSFVVVSWFTSIVKAIYNKYCSLSHTDTHTLSHSLLAQMKREVIGRTLNGFTYSISSYANIYVYSPRLTHNITLCVLTHKYILYI